MRVESHGVMLRLTSLSLPVKGNIGIFIYIQIHNSFTQSKVSRSINNITIEKYFGSGQGVLKNDSKFEIVRREKQVIRENCHSNI